MISPPLAARASGPRSHAEQREALDLLQSVLRPGRPGLLLREQPSLFGAAATGTIRVVRSEGRIAAAAGLVVREATTPTGSMRLGLVGCVVTAPPLRRRGHARTLLAACESELAALGCAAAVLWADEAEVYARCGWQEAGTEIVLRVPARPGEPAAAGTARAAPEDLDAIESLRHATSSRSDRSPAESAAHYRSGIADVRVHRDAARRIDAFAAFGRGADLAEVLHESAGCGAGRLAIAESRRRERGESETVALASPWDGELLGAALRAGATAQAGILGMTKLLRADVAATCVTRALLPRVSAEPQGGGVVLESSAGDRCALDAGETLHLLLGLRGECPPGPRIERSLGISLDGRLPIAPYLSGFDSI